MQCDTVWTNCRLLARAGQPLIDKGMIAAKNGRVVYAGPATDFDAPTIDLGRRLVTPGLIDCHTHLVFAGNRAHEFKLRLDGATYEEIARAGGGILSTVTATRAASEDELITAALPRLDALIASGVSTIEIKSGYGLTLEDELKMLRAAKALERRRPVRVMTTLLGAHALPPEYKDRPDAYIDAVCHEMIPAVVGLASAVDVFCEGIGFSPAQTERVFQAAQAHGLRVKLHAEQLSNLHGAALAARYGALSADHLEHLDADGIEAMRDAGTVATLLPGAFYFMRETYLPPIEGLRAENVPMAIATDCNPGTSPLTSILMAMNMAATCFRLTIDECLAGVTTNAAQALGLSHEIGTLEAGKSCDLAIWDCAEPADLVYFIGASPLHSRVFQGQTT
ncbi:imidazolonepropionase [Asticcacaulis taihuensis]|uniref:imidazolonepropionase n=1 Tax=Asticcacaulis taihuensis TaxID=260084 RepID=UPI003F7BD6C4